MNTSLHIDPVLREVAIARYLANRLEPGAAADFEAHYLECEECFEELRAAELLIYGLGLPVLVESKAEEVTVIRFASPAELTSTSADLNALIERVPIQAETKVLIDLSRVSRIDSAGLGMLMRCHAHAVRNSGALKLLNPNTQVKRVLSMTRIDSVVPTFDDEAAAIRSFE